MSESRLCENGVAGCRGFCIECKLDTRARAHHAMVLTEFNPPGGMQWSKCFSHVEPGLSEYAAEAWERMTYGGLNLPFDPGYRFTLEEQIDFYRNNFYAFARDFIRD